MLYSTTEDYTWNKNLSDAVVSAPNVRSKISLQIPVTLTCGTHFKTLIPTCIAAVSYWGSSNIVIEWWLSSFVLSQGIALWEGFKNNDHSGILKSFCYLINRMVRLAKFELNLLPSLYKYLHLIIHGKK